MPAGEIDDAVGVQRGRAVAAVKDALVDQAPADFERAAAELVLAAAADGEEVAAFVPPDCWNAALAELWPMYSPAADSWPVPLRL